MHTQKRVNVTLYVHCLSCLLYEGVKVSNKLASMEEWFVKNEFEIINKEVVV